MDIFQRGPGRFEIEPVDIHGEGHILRGAKDPDEERDQDEAVVAGPADEAAFVRFKTTGPLGIDDGAEFPDNIRDDLEDEPHAESGRVWEFQAAQAIDDFREIGGHDERVEDGDHEENAEHCCDGIRKIFCLKADGAALVERSRAWIVYMESADGEPHDERKKENRKKVLEKKPHPACEF